MKNMKSFGSRWWATIIWILALLIVVITFTPLILNPGKVTPRLLSLPFTLWTGIVAAILLLLLTYLSSRIRDKL
jgi:hypothetical protein